MKNRRILILGLGLSGRSAANFLLQQGASVFAVDSNQKLLQENAEIAQLLHKGLKIADESIDLASFDLVVASPGISQKHPLFALAIKQGIEVIGEVELACRFLSFKKFLGVTGTNGKTTVTLLVTHILNHSGQPARALGNMGVALTTQLQSSPAFDPSEEIIVAELSSYQLETMHSKVIDAAVLLNITPDHLDRYVNMEEYAKAKLRIAACLKLAGSFYIEQRCNNDYGYLIPGCEVKTYGYEKSCDIYADLTGHKEIYTEKQPPMAIPDLLEGKTSHDLENLMAAYALCLEAGISPEQFFKGYATFKKPPHRIEFVTKLNGVSYYDDSKGTNLDAVIRSVDSLEGSIILIAGGVDKGAPYTPWVTAFQGKVKLICAIGQAAQKIQQDLSGHLLVKLFSTLEEAVSYAAEQAQTGDNIMLSPGCSSFDMYKDYAHRGQEFQRIVLRRVK